MSELRIGVIGYGLRGGLARHAHQPENGCRVSVLYDPDPAARERFLADFPGAATVPTLEDFLSSGIDAAFVLSPDWCHEEHAVALLEAGIAVYLEKPMAITTEGCDRVLRTAREHRGRLYLGHNMRHMPFVREMKRLIDDGAIGEPKAAWCRHFVGHGGEFYFQDWHAERAKGTGLLLQKGAHDIDVLHWLCGAYAEAVSGLGDLLVYRPDARRSDAPNPPGSAPSPGRSWWQREERLTVWPPTALAGINPATDVEDVSMIHMRLGNGVLAAYQQCHFTPDYWRNYTIIGTEGRLENVGNGEPGTTIKVWNRRHGWKPDGDLEVPVVPASGGHGGADPSIVAEFLRYVREGGATETSPVAARYAVAAGCAGTASLRQNSVLVPVPPADPADVAYFEAA